MEESATLQKLRETLRELREQVDQLERNPKIWIYDKVTGCYDQVGLEWTIKAILEHLNLKVITTPSTAKLKPLKKKIRKFRKNGGK